MKKLTKIALAIGSTIALTLGMSVPANAAPVVTATKFATNSAVSTYPDVFKRVIRDLAFYGSDIYEGWGDYDANIGPIKIMSHNLSTGAETLRYTLNGEDARNIRSYNGTLYVPDIDPKLSWSSNVGYAHNTGGTWGYVFGSPAQHVFDVAVLGSEIFMAGAMTNPDKTKYGPANDIAFIKKSSDGGRTWTIEKWRSTDPAVGHSGYDRYYWLAVVNGKLHGSATVEGQKVVLDVYSAGKWTTVDSGLATHRNYEPQKVVALGNRIIGHGRNDTVWVYDSTGKGKRKWFSSVVGNTGGVLDDFYVDGNTVYAVVRNTNVQGNDNIYSSTDGINWAHRAEVDFPVPNWFHTWHNGEVTTEMRVEARSIAVKNGVAYLGTNTGEVWKVTLP
jgi:hypothetical protein